MIRHAAIVLFVLCLSAVAQAQGAPPRSAFWHQVEAAPAFEIAQGKAIARLVSEGPIYMGILEGKPGLKVPEHTHPRSAELLYVLEGGGWMTVAGKRERVKAGMVIHVPPGVKHAFEIPADWKHNFKAVQVYSPSGPEQRFKKGKRLKRGAR